MIGTAEHVAASTADDDKEKREDFSSLPKKNSKTYVKCISKRASASSTHLQNVTERFREEVSRVRSRGCSTISTFELRISQSRQIARR